jgi:hypothetical protein
MTEGILAVNEIAAAAIVAAMDGTKSIEDITGLDFKSQCFDCLDAEIESACIYNHHCLEYVSRLESEWGDQIEESGVQYAAHEWLEAAHHYAIQLLQPATSQAMHEQGMELVKRIEEFSDVVTDLGGDPTAATVSRDCDHGWAVHNRETAEGVMVWSDEPGYFNPELLEGELLAVSHRISNGFYLNTAWEPAKASMGCAK